jgi:hypothetical protein
MTHGIELKAFYPERRQCGVTAKDNRWFVEAVLWMIRMDSPWRD